jgi:hypothetical protein
MQNRDPYNFEKSTPTDPNDLSSLSQRVSTTVAEAGHEVKDKVDDLARSAKGKMDQGRQSTAGALDRAADALHRRADSLPGGPKTSDFAHSTADRIQDTAHYIRDHNFGDIFGDLENVVRRRPGQALLGALAIGFLVGRSLRKQY